MGKRSKSKQKRKKLHFRLKHKRRLERKKLAARLSQSKS